MVDVEQNADDKPEIICKLTDFGFACMLEKGEKALLNVGTPLYMAPEILKRQNYDSKVDTWALGVLAYVMLADGDFPFTGFSTSHL